MLDGSVKYPYKWRKGPYQGGNKMQVISRRATVTTSYDSDAAAWFTAVEAADGQVLPAAYKAAWNTFITGLKSNKIGRAHV